MGNYNYCQTVIGLFTQGNYNYCQTVIGFFTQRNYHYCQTVIGSVRKNFQLWEKQYHLSYLR